MLMKKCNSDEGVNFLSEDNQQKEDISFWGDSININQTRNQNNLQITQDPKSFEVDTDNNQS